MNKPLRFGLIGLGYFGKNYLRLLNEIKGTELGAVCTKEEKAFKDYDSLIPKASEKTSDANTILENPEIDCVIIATPAGTHLELAMKALENGKHVLLEKPMTPTLQEAKKLREAVSKSKLTFMVGHQYCYNDYVTWLHDNINSLGKANHIIANHLYLGPIRKDIGCFWDAGTHELSIIQYLLNPGRIVDASGMSISIAKNGIDDFTTATVRFENGLTASLTTGWFSPEKIRNLTVIGSQKMAVFDDVEPKNKLRIYPEPYPESGRLSSNIPLPEIPKINPNEPLKNEVLHFISCINSKSTPRTGIDQSFQVTEWLDEISKSVKKV